MKVGIVQPRSKENAIKMTEETLKEGAEVVLLPEKWVPSFDDVPLPEFQKLAMKYTAMIIPGAFEDGVSVISPIVDRNGNVKGIAKKVHLFGDEKGRLFPGEELVIINYNGVKIGIAICYDVDFPESIRELFRRGMEMLLVPSKIRKEGIDIWRAYLMIRALENRVAVVNANTFNPPNYPGMSIAIAPENDNGIVRPMILANMKENEEWKVIEVDTLRYMQIRSQRLEEYIDPKVKELR
ncbi:carbon-nitrogen hydrolase family protein [Sulfuracidifex metallicus]|uniref:carbon-nitrogen hydrolase family protein n=1 Tax=Sulfuracidifex metallicus TaxID=47303 RepID=UPI002273971A|nr:carbon-nitrogen hydrolase family protein [Sulfuracidifex metallicus]MCY0850313.1 carbon-nitrogen hydrolase family protein [Sulfuracidifex metallicus]